MASGENLGAILLHLLVLQEIFGRCDALFAASTTLETWLKLSFLGDAVIP